MTRSPDFGIPFLAQAQANADITHNEALILFQALSNGVINMTTNAPPGSPTEGDSYVIGGSPTGAWAGFARHIAIRWGGAWRFVPGRNSAGAIIPIGSRHEGLRVFNRADDKLYTWTGSAWSDVWNATDKVAKSGDTMTGRLVIEDVSPFPSLIIRGSTAPALADFIGDGQAAGPRIFRHSDNATPPNFVFYKTRGTEAAPSIPNTNDGVFTLLGGLWNGSAYVVPFIMSANLIAASPGAADLEMRWSLRLPPAGSGSDAELLRADHATGFSMYGANTVISANRLFRNRAFTVATLPVAAIAAGDQAVVTDANAPAIGAIVVGGGSTRCLVIYDGTNWRVA